MNLINLLSLFVPTSLTFIGARLLRKMYYNELLKDVDKEYLLRYLVQDRIFIESLSDDDIKYYKKVFISYYKIRFKQKIKKFLHINIIKNEEGS